MEIALVPLSGDSISLDSVSPGSQIVANDVTPSIPVSLVVRARDSRTVLGPGGVGESRVPGLPKPAPTKPGLIKAEMVCAGNRARLRTTLAPSCQVRGACGLLSWLVFPGSGGLPPPGVFWVDVDDSVRVTWLASL